MITREEAKDLRMHNTFRMKARCAAFVEYDTVDDIFHIDFTFLPKPVRSIGAGSNLLITKDFPGTLLHSRIRFLREIASHDDDVLVEAGAGVPFDSFVDWSCSLRLWGAENLSRIPGDVGAAAVQNIGAYGVEVSDIIVRVNCFDCKERKMVTFEKKDCMYGYRDSYFKSHDSEGRYIVTSVLFKLTREKSPRLDYGNLRELVGSKTIFAPNDVRKVINAIRAEKYPDPKVMGSAGSFFINPVVTDGKFREIEELERRENGAEAEVPHVNIPGGVRIHAAWLIDRCGLKGMENGGAAVFENQPLVLVNKTGKATAREVLELEATIRDTVMERFGVELQAEVEHI